MNELGPGFAGTLPAIVANRLMIAVRRHYYGGESNADTDEPSPTTVQFRTAPTHATSHLSAAESGIERPFYDADSVTGTRTPETSVPRTVLMEE